MLKYYSTDEVAELLGITRRSVYNYIKSGELKGKLIARKWRFTEDAIREFADVKINKNDGSTSAK